MKHIYNLFILTAFIFFNTNFIYGQNNLAITNTTLTQDQYTKIPLAQISAMATGGVVENIGTAESTNVVLTVLVLNSSSSVVYSESSNSQSITAGSSLPITFTGFTPTVEDTYTTTYNLTLAETDQDPSNNTKSSNIEVTSNTYARDNNTRTTALGAGVGTSALIGQQYDILVQQDIISVTFEISNPSENLNGITTYVTIWNMVSDIPNAIIAQTETVTINGINQTYTANIIGGSFSLNPDKYLVAIVEDSTSPNISLSGTSEIFTPNTVWASINSGTWTLLEDLGFPNSYIIRPNFQIPSLSILENQISNNLFTIYPNPSQNFIKINGLLESLNYTIYDILGNKISNGIISKNEKIDIQSFFNGLYFLKFENGNTLKFIKE